MTVVHRQLKVNDLIRRDFQVIGDPGQERLKILGLDVVDVGS